jgi:hypothetical protein
MGRSAEGTFHTSMGRSPMNTSPGTKRAESPVYRPSGLCEVPSARSDSEIRLVHLDLYPVVLVWPCVTRNVESDLILEELTLFIAPSVGLITSSVGAIGNLYLLRAYSDGPKRPDGLRQVVVENLEVLLLKIGDTLSGRRRNYDIQANASSNWTAFGTGLLSKSCSNTKHHRRQNAKYTLADEHKLTPIDVLRSLWAKSPVRNCTPEHMPREVSSRPQWTIAGCPIHGAISSQHERAVPHANASLSFAWHSKGKRYTDNLVRVPPCR